MSVTRNLTRDLVHGLTRGVNEDWFAPPVSYEFTLAGDSLVWTSDETVAVAVIGLTIPASIPDTYKFYAVASLNADCSSPFDTALTVIGPTDASDLQIDDAPFASFAAYDGQAVYIQAWIINDLGDDPVANQASNKSNIVTRTMALGDSAAPILSSPVDTATSSIAGSGSVSTDEGNGTLFWVVSTSATPPSAAQVKAGQMHTGAAAADSGSQAVSGTGVQNISGGFTGLAAATAYTAHYMHEDAATNQSTVSSGDGFTTQTAFSVSFLGSNSQPADQASYTISAADFGVADSNRKIVIALLASATGLTITGVTIGGVTASPISGAVATTAGAVTAYMFEAVVPSGASGDIVVTCSATAGRFVAAWWRVISGTASSGQGAVGASVTSVSTAVTIPTDGVGLYACYQFTNSGFLPWTNLSTEDFDIVAEGNRAWSGGRRTVAGSTSVTANWSGPSDPNLVACAYGP